MTQFDLKKSSTLLILIGLLLATFTTTMPTIAATTYTLENDLIKLSSPAYEVAFQASNGGIAYIIDSSTGQQISDGSADGLLWSASVDKAQPINSGGYGADFSHTWDEASSQLTLTYTGALTVTVTVDAADETALKLQAVLSNATGNAITDFAFPKHLTTAGESVQDALLPMMPGALINPTFFAEGRNYVGTYPGIMFADYLALRSARGSITLYSQRGDVLQPALIGFEHNAGITRLTHTYRTWILNETDWTSPWVVLAVGEDYPQTISRYRADNSIDEFKSLTEKLGEAAGQYFASPLYKLDLVVLRKTFAELEGEVADKLTFPGMIHFVAFQPGGHDRNYPDFIPADPKWGTTEDFAALVSTFHEQGSLAVPYTNFSWWDNDGPTMANLPADTPLNSVINVKDSFGLPGFETYGPNSGFVMNVHNAFAQAKIAEQHGLLRETVGVDAIFEDQWGARSAPYDFNPAGLDDFDPATSYFEGVLHHYRVNAASNLMTEIGVDVLAENGVAFMGTNYLWDMLGYRGATAGVTSYYPMAGMLLRDKVLLYQHDLAAETWTNNLDMLRWNLAYGYGLSNAFLDGRVSRLNMDNPWLNLVGAFHAYALAHYADELVTAYDDLGEGITRTTFASYSVHANWNADQPYSIADHTLPPGGVITQAHDDSVTAGAFTAYNNHPLTDDVHYLIEVRSDSEIRVLQPIGQDTDLVIRKPENWASVIVTPYAYDGTALGTVAATIDDDDITFTYVATLNGAAVGYYTITPA